MQFLQEDKEKNRRRTVIIAVAAVIVILLILLITGVIGGGSRRVSAVKLRCAATQAIMPFGDSVLFYDGTSLVCLSSNNSERWSYAVGSDASFDARNGTVVVWSGTQLSFLDKNGRSTYDDNIGDSIQFARAGEKYVAVVLGNDSAAGEQSTLRVLNLQGDQKDVEVAAYQDKLILDVGFFGNGEYLWSTAMDLYGTVPSTTLNTYQVGVMTIGSVDLGDTVTYKMLYAGNKLHAISTRQLRVYDYRGTIDSTGTLLVYGWQLIDEGEQNGNAMMLFAPTRQTAEMTDLTELRYLSGKTDKRFTLPDACVGAALHGRRIYAFSADSIYRADLSAQRFSAVSLPSSIGGATGYLGMLDNGVALLSSDLDVFAVTLP